VVNEGVKVEVKALLNKLAVVGAIGLFAADKAAMYCAIGLIMPAIGLCVAAKALYKVWYRYAGDCCRNGEEAEAAAAAIRLFIEEERSLMLVRSSGWGLDRRDNELEPGLLDVELFLFEPFSTPALFMPSSCAEEQGIEKAILCPLWCPSFVSPFEIAFDFRFLEFVVTVLEFDLPSKVDVDVDPELAGRLRCEVEGDEDMAVLEATVLLAPKWASDMLDVIVPAELTPLELPTLPGLHEELTGEGVDVLLATDNGNDGSEGVGAVDEEVVEFCRRTLANSAILSLKPPCCDLFIAYKITSLLALSGCVTNLYTNFCPITFLMIFLS
jgi:hypothetical protein